MREDIMVGTRNYFLVSLFMGVIIILSSLHLHDEVFRSAMIFGISSGTAICLLSLVEIYSLYRVVRCPICDEKIDPGYDECPNCGFKIRRRK